MAAGIRLRKCTKKIERQGIEKAREVPQTRQRKDQDR
jgi:hypothetical protein